MQELMKKHRRTMWEVTILICAITTLTITNSYMAVHLGTGIFGEGLKESSIITNTTSASTTTIKQFMQVPLS